jgi:hypothetical protein
MGVFFQLKQLRLQSLERYSTFDFLPWLLVEENTKHTFTTSQCFVVASNSGKTASVLFCTQYRI